MSYPVKPDTGIPDIELDTEISETVEPDTGIPDIEPDTEIDTRY